MKDIQQLIKKNSQEGRYEDIFPKTFIDAVNKDFALFSSTLNRFELKINRLSGIISVSLFVCIS